MFYDEWIPDGLFAPLMIVIFLIIIILAEWWLRR